MFYIPHMNKNNHLKSFSQNYNKVVLSSKDTVGAKWLFVNCSIISPLHNSHNREIFEHFFPGSFTILSFVRNKPIFSSGHFLCLLAITY